MTDLARWLEAHNLARHLAVLKENDIDLDILGELSEEDLKELGLSLGDRRRMAAAIRSLTDGGSEPEKSKETSKHPRPSGLAVSVPRPAATDSANARRQVTVLFADLSGFTTLSTSLDAEEVHKLLQRYFAVVDEIINGFGGTIDKHIGDAVMAVFGAPVAHTDDPQRAVRAAMDIHRQLADFSPPLIAHVGIASGQVVAGRTGSSAFDEYTMTGASVNLAARLQDLAGPGETLISDAVQNAVSSLASTEFIGDVEVKGFKEPVKTWRLTGIRRATDADSEGPFVGRTRELRQLRGAVSECRETGGGQLVLLRGEAGIGKTRLVDRFEAEVVAGGFACHTALVLDFGAGKGRDAIPALVRSLLGIAPGIGKAIRRAAADAVLSSGLLDQDRAVHLNDLLDLPQPEPLRTIHDSMDHPTRMRGLADTVGALAHATAGRSPLLLRIEDIHWADPLLLDRLAVLAEAIADRPVIMLMTSRIEGDPISRAWRAKVRRCPLTTIDLGPLNDADAADLAKEYRDANDALAQACIARAAGNPLFLDQLLRNARENAEHAVPGSVQSIVQARLDHLGDGDRRAIQAAAVLGQRFLAATVAAMVGDAAYDCTGLVTHQLVRPEDDGFLFVHALVRDGVYGTLRGEDRRALHVAAADWFAGRDLGLRARHLEAGEHPDAAKAYLAASREQLRAYHYDQALSLSEAAIRLAAGEAERFEALCLAGEVRQLIGDSAVSIERYEEALSLANMAADQVRCLLGLAAGMRILDKFDQAFTRLDEATEICLSSGLDAPLAEIEFTRGNLYFPLGRTEECLAAHEKAVAHARTAGNTELQIQALGGLADASYASCRIESARGYFTECVALARREGFHRIEEANIPMVAWTTLFSGDYVNAFALLKEAGAVSERAGNVRARIIAGNGLVLYALFRGDYPGAEKHAFDIIQQSERISSGRFQSYGFNMLAMTQIARVDKDAARRSLAAACDAAEGPAFQFCGAWIRGTEALLADSPAAAHRALDAGEAMLDAGAIAHNHVFYRYSAIEYALQTGDWDRLEHHAAKLTALMSGEPTRFTDFIVDRARALAAVRQGTNDEVTRAALGACLAFARDQGLRPAAEALEAALDGS